jgi:hypothetical protein
MFNNYDKEVCVGMSSFRIVFFVATCLKKIIGALSIEIPARIPKISLKKSLIEFTIFNAAYLEGYLSIVILVHLKVHAGRGGALSQTRSVHNRT